MLNKGGRGARRSGAGRKDLYRHLKMQVKDFVERERSKCHHLDTGDVLDEFIDKCEEEARLGDERLKQHDEE